MFFSFSLTPFFGVGGLDLRGFFFAFTLYNLPTYLTT
jgi:hypothetical protein